MEERKDETAWCCAGWALQIMTVCIQGSRCFWQGRWEWLDLGHLIACRYRATYWVIRYQKTRTQGFCLRWKLVGGVRA